MLHNDKELFKQVVLRTADDMGVNAAIIEKDYYVTLFLKSIVNVQPNIIFKGGTSLSKCYKLIERFSEDIDLNIETESGPTESQRKTLKNNIVSVIDDFGFSLTNAPDILSRRSYNKYIVDYPSVFGDAEYLKENLIIETSVYIRAYPTNRMKASSLIYDYLNRNGYKELVTKYNLEPFEVNVQTAERTLIDKVYALGDYYLDNRISEHSRHIYDLYKLFEVVSLDDNLKSLVKEVAKERRQHAASLSAQEGVDIKALLNEIITNDVYKADYESITSSLLFTPVDYSIAITAVSQIINSGIFDN